MPGRGPLAAEGDRSLDVGEQPPGRQCRGDRAEHLALVPQHGQVRDGFPAISQHHREVGGDPARVVTSAPWPKWPKRGGVRAGQFGGIGKISQQPCPGVTNHPGTVSRGIQAFRLDRQNPSTRFIAQLRRHFRVTSQNPTSLQVKRRG